MHDTTHPHDELPLFDRAKRVIHYLRQAADRGEWQEVHPSPTVQDLLPAEKADLPEDHAGEAATRFGYALTIPFASAYRFGQSGHRHKDIEEILTQAAAYRDTRPGRAQTPEGGPIREVKIAGKIKLAYGDCGKPGNEAGGFTLYTNHPKVFPFRALEEKLDRFREEMGKDWEMKDGKLVREFNPIGRDFLTAEHILHRMMGIHMWKFPEIEFVKNGQVVHNPYPLIHRKDGTPNCASVFESLMRNICGINDMSELPWEDGMQALKFVMAMEPDSRIPDDVASRLMTKIFAVAEQKGVSARITIADPDDIVRFGKEVGRDFTGKDRSVSGA
jgi:hypothetical protein